MNNDITFLKLKKNNISNFAVERNKLLKKVKTDWAFFIDSDEKLVQPITNIDSKYDGYFIPRKNYFLGQYVGTDMIVRLGKKDFKTWSRPVHEVWKIKNTSFIDGSYIVHNTADNLFGYIKKVNVYSSLHAIANSHESKKSSLFKIFFFPIAKFIVTYFKSKHIVFSITQSFHSYLSWSKLYFLQH